MTIPWAEPLTPIEPGPRVVPEPPRRGEAGGEPCRVCERRTTEAVWSDDHFTMHPPIGGSLPGTVWVASQEHVDSFADLSPDAAAAFGPWPPASSGRSSSAATSGASTSTAGATAARTSTCGSCRARSGMLEASGAMLPLWEDGLPNVPDDELLAAAREIAERLA